MKQKLKVVFILGLVVVALVLIAREVWPLFDGDPTGQTATETETPAPETTLPEADDFAIETETAYPRDPFSFPQGPASEETAPIADEGFPVVEVSAIWLQDGQALALVDGRICRLGEQLEWARIVSIEAQGVWLERGPLRQFVPVRSSGVITPPPADSP